LSRPPPALHCTPLHCTALHCTDRAQLFATATTPASQLTCQISGVIFGGIELPFNGCPKNACKNLSDGEL
jgi:hypothetical protein